MERKVRSAMTVYPNCEQKASPATNIFAAAMLVHDLEHSGIEVNHFMAFINTGSYELFVMDPVKFSAWCKENNHKPLFIDRPDHQFYTTEMQVNVGAIIISAWLDEYQAKKLKEEWDLEAV